VRLDLRKGKLQESHIIPLMTFSPTLFRVGVLYERIRAANFLEPLRSSLCVFEKTGNTKGLSDSSDPCDHAQVEVS
jgi:hypothetical protein